MARSNGDNESNSNVVTPVNLAKEMSVEQGKLVRPQIIFSYIRSGKLPSHRCVCDHIYLLRDEVQAFFEEKAAKDAEKAAKVAAELEGEAETEQEEAIAS